MTPGMLRSAGYLGCITDDRNSLYFQTNHGLEVTRRNPSTSPIGGLGAHISTVADRNPVYYYNIPISSKQRLNAMCALAFVA